MCFSTEASFGAGAILTGISYFSFKRAKTSNELLFAGIPLLFAVQQISEGFLWLSLTKPDFAFLEGIMTYTFLIFSQVVWPLWVPFSIYKMEVSPWRRKILGGMVICGAIVSVYMIYCFASFPAYAVIENRHISYKQHFFESAKLIGGALYLIATLGPPFFSGRKRMIFLGLSIFAAYLFTTLFYRPYLVSIWCYLAALISVIVVLVLDRKEIRNYPQAKVANTK
jgi:hypothetical protein